MYFRRVRSWEPLLQWAALVIFSAGIVFSIVWNVMANTWIKDFFPPLDKSPLEIEHCRDLLHVG